MIESIRWSRRAEEDYVELMDFLKKEWDKGLAMEFNASVSLFLARIRAFPKIYPATTENPFLRKAVISSKQQLFIA